LNTNQEEDEFLNNKGVNVYTSPKYRKDQDLAEQTLKTPINFTGKIDDKSRPLAFKRSILGQPNTMY